MARFGAVVQIGGGEQGSEEKPKYAGLNPDQSLETVTLEQALELFKFPKDLGMFEDKAVNVGLGRFGPYIRHDSKFTSIPKEMDPLAVTLNEAIDLIKAKRESDAKKLLKVFPEDEEIRILDGRWGPYISYQKKSIRIPKDVEPKSVTLEQARELIKNAPAKGARRKGKAKKK